MKVKVVNNLKHVAQLQIEATVFKGGHTAKIQQLRVSHIPVMTSIVTVERPMHDVRK